MKKMYKVTGLWLEVNQYLKNKKNNFHMKSGNSCSKQMCQVAWSFLYTENPLTTVLLPTSLRAPYRTWIGYVLQVWFTSLHCRDVIIFVLKTP